MNATGLREVREASFATMKEFSKAWAELSTTTDPARAISLLEDLGWSFLARAQELRDGASSP